MQQLSKFSFVTTLWFVPAGAACAQADFSAANDNTTLWIAVISAAILVLALTQVFSRTVAGGATARNLFLRVNLRLTEDNKNQSGWIRALEARSAVVVSGKLFSKGERLRIDLSALPDFPAAEDTPWVDAEVARVRSLGGDPATFEMRLNFPGMKLSLRAFLTTCVRRLAASGRTQNA